MRPTHFEDNAIAILSFAASSQATWVSATTISKHCNIDYDLVRLRYLADDRILCPVAAHYRYDYKIRRRRNPVHGHTYSISVVSRGYEHV